MVSFISKFFNIFRAWKKTKPAKSKKEPICELGKWELVLMKIYKIIIWENFFLSSFFVICLNIIFWILVHLDLRFYAIVFITYLLLTLEQIWASRKYSLQEKKNSESSIGSSINGSESVTDFEKAWNKYKAILKSLYSEAKSLRQTQPGKFCVCACTLFLLLREVGKVLSSLISLYALLMLFATVPGIVIHFLLPYLARVLPNFFHNRDKGEEILISDDEVESFLPETNLEVLEILRLAGDLPPLNSQVQDSDVFVEQMSVNNSDLKESMSSKLSIYSDFSFTPFLEKSTDSLDLDLPASQLPIAQKSQPCDSKDVNILNKYFDDESSDDELRPDFSLTINKNCQNNTNIYADDLKSYTRSLEHPNRTNKTKCISINDIESSSDTDSFEIILDGSEIL